MASPQPRLRLAACSAALAGLTLPMLATSAHAEDAPAPTFADVSVHDPSIVTSGDDVWVFGSHGASAFTQDLMHWTQHTRDLSQEPDNALFEDIYAELEETFDWAESSTLWASDVIQLADGRYYMYYNACRGDSPRSALGVAVSDSVDGPYEDLGILLKSGHRAGEVNDATEDGSYDGNTMPNAVDPDVFYDAQGKLWMVYGSYSGGIFILELDATTGMPLPDQGYGTHLIGGYHSRIEAPNIRYDESTGFYYLYLSFGGLDADGGYDTRVFRSESPDGPYVDAEGHLASEVMGTPGTIFDDQAYEPYGVKLLGGHLWKRELGDPGTGLGPGNVSPGHNSTYEDPDTGETFLVYHSRFPGTGERHQVRVSQMWMNADGWPVVSPFRYAGESAQPVAETDVTGSWQLINQGKDITAEAATPVTVTLEGDGDIVGGAHGTWDLTGANTAELTIDGEDFSGVFVPIWDPQLEQWSTGLTVQSGDGVSVLGREWVSAEGQEALDAAAAQLDLGDTSGVAADLTLPTSATAGITIAWESSQPAVVSTSGEVTRPSRGEDDAQVTLTATLSSGDLTASRTFDVTVLARTAAALTSSWSFEGDLSDATGTFADAEPTGARATAVGGTVDYTNDGVLGGALHLDGTNGVRLPDGLLSGPSYSASLWVRPETHVAHTTAFFGGSSDPERWISLVTGGTANIDETLLWATTPSSPYYGQARTGSLIPLDQWSNITFTVDGSEVAVYVDGELAVARDDFPGVFTTDDALFALGVNHWDQPFTGDIDELTTWDSALLADEVASLVRLDAPLASYDFEGDLSDSTGTQADATTTGARVTTSGGTVTYVNGVEGEAVSLDGASGVRLADGLIHGTEYSVSMWLKPEVLSNFTSAFFGAPIDAAEEYRWVSVMPSSWDGNLMVWSSNEDSAARYFGDSFRQLAVDQWAHVALTVDDGAATLYLDGEPVHTGTGFYDVFDTEQMLFALGVNRWDTPFTGAFDAVKVYDYALSAQTVASQAGAVVADLRAAIAEARALDLSGYTTASVATLEATLTEALPLLDALRPAQSGVDDAAASVRAAVAALEERPALTLRDIAGNPFRAEIEWLAATGVTTGWATSTPGVADFRPLSNVNRDQMAAFLYRLAGEPEFTAPEEPTFLDVPTDYVFYKEIEWLATTGVTEGWTVDEGAVFRPRIAVNRDVMAAFLYRYAGSPTFDAPAVSPFVDVKTNHVFYKEIAWLNSTGISQGWTVDGDKQFRTTTPVKRDVMAAFLSRYADQFLED